MTAKGGSVSPIDAPASGPAARPSAMQGVGATSSRLRRVAYLGDLIRELLVRDFKVRYRRSVLGIGWSLMNPLAQFAVFYAVFRWIIPVDVPDYAVFLLTGLLAWSWFQSALLAGCVAITENGSLLRQPAFPMAVLPVVAVGTHLVTFLLALPVLAIALLVAGRQPTYALLALPVVIALQFLVTLGAVYVFSAMHVRYRDTQYLLGVALLLGFYVSPVLYPTQSVPADWQAVMLVNPLAHVLHAYRAILIEGRMPAWQPLVSTAVFAVILLMAGYSLFVRMRHHFVDEIGA
jgi:lipopolysaccharide transport system permease protein